MNQSDLRIKAMELWNVLKGRDMNPAQCVDMIFNSLRNTAIEMSEEEHAKRLKAEAEVVKLKSLLEAVPVAEVCA